MGASNVTLPTTVVKGANASIVRGTAAVAIAAGQSIYLDTTVNKWRLAMGDTAIKAASGGIALNTAAVDQPLEILVEGDLTGCSGLTVGEVYVVSDNLAGAVMFNDDIIAAKFVTVIGVPSSATVMKVKLFASGVAHA